MRKFIVVFLLCCVAYFGIGWYGQAHEWLTMEDYLTYGGIVGGLASIFGLFGFLKPPMSRQDIQNIEIESLKKVVEVSEEIKRLEEAQNQQLSKIDDLEKQSKEMEFLVRKASLSLFFQEQRKYTLKKIQTHIESYDELRLDLESLTEIDQKLDTLNEEIEKDRNVEQLKRVINEASFNSLGEYSENNFRSSYIKSIFMLLKSLDEMTSILKRKI